MSADEPRSLSAPVRRFADAHRTAIVRAAEVSAALAIACLISSVPFAVGMALVVVTVLLLLLLSEH